MAERHDLDIERAERQGFPEVVYGESKSSSDLMEIMGALKEKTGGCLITRLSARKAQELIAAFPDAKYHQSSRTLVMSGCPVRCPPPGKVIVVSAGTSDSPVSDEVAAVLSFLGVSHEVYQDKGVAGLHRLLALTDVLRAADVVICVAGFEGALASVVAGLVPAPVIGVPTSVGYGVARGGETALRAMLASCANGLLVVNIDNGYGAAMAAFRILQRASHALAVVHDRPSG